MHPNGDDPERRAEQRAVLQRLRRAARGGPPGGAVPDAHAPDLAVTDA